MRVTRWLASGQFDYRTGQPQLTSKVLAHEQTARGREDCVDWIR